MTLRDLLLACRVRCNGTKNISLQTHLNFHMSILSDSGDQLPFVHANIRNRTWATCMGVIFLIYWTTLSWDFMHIRRGATGRGGNPFNHNRGWHSLLTVYDPILNMVIPTTCPCECKWQEMKATLTKYTTLSRRVKSFRYVKMNSLWYSAPVYYVLRLTCVWYSASVYYVLRLSCVWHSARDYYVLQLTCVDLWLLPIKQTDIAWNIKKTCSME